MTNEELLQRIIQLELVIASMRNSSSIPFDIGAAFNDRLGSQFQLTDLNGGIYSKSVNESGSATYSVAKLPDGSATAVYNGTIIRIPFYV